MAVIFLLAALDETARTRGVLLLACIVALGILGILMIVGLSVARHRHWQRLRQNGESHQKHLQEHPPVDPWEEAGRRMEVPDLLETGADKDDSRPS